jgi:hypothetical protein
MNCLFLSSQHRRSSEVLKFFKNETCESMLGLLGIKKKIARLARAERYSEGDTSYFIKN